MQGNFFSLLNCYSNRLMIVIFLHSIVKILEQLLLQNLSENDHDKVTTYNHNR